MTARIISMTNTIIIEVIIGVDNTIISLSLSGLKIQLSLRLSSGLTDPTATVDNMHIDAMANYAIRWVLPNLCWTEVNDKKYDDP